MSVSAISKALKIITEHGGIIQTSAAIKAGIQPRTLYALRDSGELEQLARGLYKLPSVELATDIDNVTIALKFPKVVICLISALFFHDLTTQIPHTIHIAIKQGDRAPCIDYPPISVYRFSEKGYSVGVETHVIDGIPVKIYNPEKTLVDCFKFRNKIGMDVFLEALKFYKLRRKFKVSDIMEYARICKVEKAIIPYLEATI